MAHTEQILKEKLRLVSIYPKKSQLVPNLLISHLEAVIVNASTRKETRAMSTNRFRSTVEKIMNNPDSYTKEELHDLFLEMTERYLTELLSSMNYEKVIIDSLGEEKGNEVIEKVATSNPEINDVDRANGEEEDIKNKITNLFNTIEKMQTGDSTESNFPIGLE